MRAREFISEGQDPSALNNLLDALEEIRNRFRHTDQAPRIRIDSLVNMVRTRPGSEMFNVDTLKNLYDKKSAVKNIISKISGDENGFKYIYLNPSVSDTKTIDIGPETDSNEIGNVSGGDQSVSTVSKMAKRAASKRS